MEKCVEWVHDLLQDIKTRSLLQDGETAHDFGKEESQAGPLEVREPDPDSETLQCDNLVEIPSLSLSLIQLSKLVHLKLSNYVKPRSIPNNINSKISSVSVA
ncbi:Uncharacterized protein Rs2_03693 [Raphanus sativus]|nr:Uncharacterized protein Rs2_03693 [Raphanus sativus]